MYARLTKWYPAHSKALCAVMIASDYVSLLSFSGNGSEKPVKKSDGLRGRL